MSECVFVSECVCVCASGARASERIVCECMCAREKEWVCVKERERERICARRGKERARARRDKEREGGREEGEGERVCPGVGHQGSLYITEYGCSLRICYGQWAIPYVLRPMAAHSVVSAPAFKLGIESSKTPREVAHTHLGVFYKYFNVHVCRNPKP